MSQLMPSSTSLHPLVSYAIQKRSSSSRSSFGRVYVLPRILSMLAAPIISNQTIARRSGNYKPSIWGHDFVQSLKTEYDPLQEESWTRYRNKFKEDVLVMIKEVADKDVLHQLELIDTLQRLGLSYHFEDEIKNILEKVYTDHNYCNFKLKQDSLYAKALMFKLLREHGYYVPQDLFNDFRDDSGNFKARTREECDKAMLYLFEASFLSMEGESILDEAKSFTRRHLNEYLKSKEDKDPYFSTLVEHALEFPLHWRMLRMEARWFIQVYQQNPDKNLILLDLAKLDFNILQSMYQEDLKHASRWWKKTCLGEKLGFIRDRLMENFLWTIGSFFQPQYGYFRRMMSQINALITTIDDVYDVYGTLEELELFTDVVERWDINAIEQLPDYMKLCFFALHNSMSQMALDIFQKQGINILPYSKKAWADLCKAYLVEAKWYYMGYTPTLQEYLENAVVSISAPLLLMHTYAFTTNHIKRDTLKYLEDDSPNLIRCSSLVLRLADDLGTSSGEMSRGDTPKSIQCYMYETGASEEDAREYIGDLIDITWKKMNKEMIKTSPLIPQNLIEASLNLGRMAQFMYRHGDGHSSQDHVMRNRVQSLLINPIAG